MSCRIEYFKIYYMVIDKFFFSEYSYKCNKKRFLTLRLFTSILTGLKEIASNYKQYQVVTVVVLKLIQSIVRIMELYQHPSLLCKKNVCFGRQLLKPRIGQQIHNSSLLINSKRHKKRKLALLNQDSSQNHNLVKCKNELQEAQVEKWLLNTGRFSKKKMWKIEQKRVLKDWFDLIDRDKSGEIDIEELADPLISAGITKSMSEVKDIVRKIDEDGSSSVDFHEFLKMMKDDKNATEVSAYSKGVNKIQSTRNKKKLPADINPIVQLTKRRQDDLLDFHSVLSYSRRKILLDATMEQCCRREKAHEQIAAWRAEMKSLKGVKKLRKGLDISVLIQKIETDRIEKENFIRVMEDVLQNKTTENIQPVVKSNKKYPKDKNRTNLSILSHVTRRKLYNGVSREALLHPRIPSIHRIVGDPSS